MVKWANFIRSLIIPYSYCVTLNEKAQEPRLIKDFNLKSLTFFATTLLIFGYYITKMNRTL